MSRPATHSLYGGEIKVNDDKKKSSLINLADIEPGEQRWLWRGYIPRGEVSLLTGLPGAGKTSVVVSWAAIVASGGTWPDGTQAEQGRVLYVDAENGVANLRRRFVAQGFEAWDNLRTIDDLGPLEGLNFHKSPGTSLKPAIEEFQPDLVIIDPLVAVHHSNENSATDMRKLMMKLNSLARKHDLAIVFIQHPKKGSGGPETHQVRGSSDITAAVRAMFKVTESREKDVMALVVEKLNVGPIPPPQGFELIGGSLQWVGEVKVPTKGEGKLDEAIAFLQEWLINKSKLEIFMRIMARNEGISFRHLKQAREALGVRRWKSSATGEWYWDLS